MSLVTNPPRVGMLAIVRNRRGLITAVEPSSDTNLGCWHLVRIEYVDTEGESEETLIWEHEAQAKLLEPSSLPKVEDTLPMKPKKFDALQRAARWGALSPFLSIAGLETMQKHLYSSPFFGAVQVEEFQLLPLAKALSMSRISLLLADDVGLGKTVEAGLILEELLLRRRVRKVLILTPAALKKQWQQEMLSKFSLTFDVIDRSETDGLQKRLGLDANPWRIYPRIISSYYYLKQPNVLEQFRTTFQIDQNSPHLPWDLLIVDEAHNLMPANFGQDSDLAEMLRLIAPYFEHKLFLSATPHNGHSRCFTGLLEQLDPVRFQQDYELTPNVQERISEVVIRRLKREINQWDEENGHSPRFGERYLEPLPLFFESRESQLSEVFENFRLAVKRLITGQAKTEQLAGSFAVEVLNKRLLSCPYTFAKSWYRFQEGIYQEELVKTLEVQAAKKALIVDLDDDLEVESRIQYAAKTTGAWLKPLLSYLHPEIDDINQALTALGLTIASDNQTVLSWPVVDSRWERLLKLIKERLRTGQEWIKEERLIIFTEYKTTLDYLASRLHATFKDAETSVQVLFGGMPETEREAIKQAFNDPEHSLRILVATDAASEGLNLQETARLVLHYDIPWNPSRLDQRNGRLDRHGQARDVFVFHFTSEDNADLRFLARVAEKVNTIREDLGSMEAVFDVAFQRRFIDFQDDQQILRNLDQAIANRRGRALIPRQVQQGVDEALAKDYEAFKQALDLAPETLKSTLEIALGLGITSQTFRLDDQGRFHLPLPIPKQWEKLVDDHLRQTQNQGSLPAVVFDPQYFIQIKNHRPVFRATKDTTLLHLGHPLFHQALALLSRARFPGESQNETRWIVRYGRVPPELDGILLLTVEELAVNALRETFHHWVTTVRFAIRGGELGERLDPILPALDQENGEVRESEVIAQAQELWGDLERDVKKQISQLRSELTERLQNALAQKHQEAAAEEKSRFKARIQEVKRAMSHNSIQKLEAERDELLQEMRQLTLLIEEESVQRERLKNLEEELNRRQHHYENLLNFLEQERSRVLDRVLHQRYQMRGNAQVFPVTIEIRFPYPSIE